MSYNPFAGRQMLICPKCTRYIVLPAESLVEAAELAEQRGWLVVEDKVICPRCRPTVTVRDEPTPACACPEEEITAEYPHGFHLCLKCGGRRKAIAARILR